VSQSVNLCAPVIRGSNNKADNHKEKIEMKKRVHERGDRRAALDF